MDFPKDYPIPDDYLLELGRVTALWVGLESAVDNAINYLSGLETQDHWRCAVLTAHSNFRQRVDIIKTLCSELQKSFPNLSKYPETIKLIEEAQKKRNRYSHNAITYNEETGKVQTAFLQARGSLKVKIEDIVLDDIKDTAKVIHLSLLSLHGLITNKYYKPIWER